jgi:phosphotransferase system  glucose/maltose/N-acetylglucosamine-specific IIC component
VVLFDTSSAPVSSGVVYARVGTTVTVTKTTHGLTTGTVIGIHFLSNSGVSATDGTYTITVTGANTFTLTDINTGNISSTSAVYAVGKWLMTYEPTATDIFNNVPFIPGEGVRVETGVYAEMSNMDSVQIFYG